MDDILRLADKLGKAVAETRAAKDYRAAREALSAREDVMELLRQFQHRSTEILKATREQKPIEPEQKHALSDAHQKLIAQDVFKAFNAAQVEFYDLLRKINAGIQEHLQEIEGPLPGAQAPEDQA